MTTPEAAATTTAQPQANWPPAPDNDLPIDLNDPLLTSAGPESPCEPMTEIIETNDAPIESELQPGMLTLPDLTPSNTGDLLLNGVAISFLPNSQTPETSNMPVERTPPPKKDEDTPSPPGPMDTTEKAEGGKIKAQKRKGKHIKITIRDLYSRFNALSLKTGTPPGERIFNRQGDGGNDDEMNSQTEGDNELETEAAKDEQAAAMIQIQLEDERRGHDLVKQHGGLIQNCPADPAKPATVPKRRGMETEVFNEKVSLAELNVPAKKQRPDEDTGSDLA